MEPFQDFKYEKVALLNMKRSKCLKMCCTSRDIIMSEWGGEGGGEYFHKSADVGGRHGAGWCKAAAHTLDTIAETPNAMRMSNSVF